MSESNELPAGASSPESIEFSKIVESSKADLAAQAAAQVKRSRGRPPGTGKHQLAAAEAAKSSPNASADPAGVATPIPVLNEVRPVVRDALKVPFSVMALRFEDEALNVTEQDTDTPAFYLSNYLHAVFPQLQTQDAKTFNLLAFVFSYVMVWLKKAPLMAKKKTRPSAPPRSESGSTTEFQKNPTTVAPTEPPPATPAPAYSTAGAFFGSKV